MTHDRVQLAGPDLVLQWTPSRAWPPVPAPARELITQREESTEGCDHMYHGTWGRVCAVSGVLGRSEYTCVNGKRLLISHLKR